MGKNKKITVGVASLTLLKALNIIIPFICTPYVSRVLGAENIGIYSYTNSFATYLAMFAALGTLTYGAREISRNRDDIYARSKAFWEIEIITVVTSLICVVFWLLFAINYGEYRQYFLILTINIIAVLFDVTWLFYGLEEYGYLVVRTVIIKIVGVVAIFTILKSSKDLILYFIIMVATQLLSNIIAWFGMSNYIIKVRFNELRFKRHIKETMIFFIPSIATSVYNVLDKSFLGIIRNDRYESGCYEQAEIIINMIKGVSYSALNIVVGVRNSYLYKKNEISVLKNNIKNSLDFVFASACGFLFGIIALSRDFVSVYLGDGYELVIPLLVVFAPAILFVGISDCLGSQYYIPVGKRRISARFIVLGAVVNVILNIIMIPSLGALGAAIATVIAEGIITILYVANAIEYCSVKLIMECSYKKLISGIVMLLLIMICPIFSTINIINLIVNVLLGVCIYVIMLVLLKDDFIYMIFGKDRKINDNQ